MVRKEIVAEIDKITDSSVDAVRAAVYKGYRLGSEETKEQIIKWIDDNAFEYVQTKTVGIDEIYKGFDSERMIADLKQVIEEKL